MDGFSLIVMARMIAFSRLAVKYGGQSYRRYRRHAADSIKNGRTFLKANAQSQVRSIPLAKTMNVFGNIDSAVDQGKKQPLIRELSKVRRELQEQYDEIVEQMEKQGIMQD